MKVKIEYEFDSNYECPYFAYYVDDKGIKQYTSSLDSFEKAKERLIDKLLRIVPEIPKPEEVEVKK